MKIKDETLESLVRWTSYAGIAILLFTTYLFSCKSETNIKIGQTINTTAFNDFGSFLSGSAGLLFTIATTILVYMTYKSQKKS